MLSEASPCCHALVPISILRGCIPYPAALPAAQRGPRRANSVWGIASRLRLCLPFKANIPAPDGLIHNADKQVIACLCRAVSAGSPAL